MWQICGGGGAFGQALFLPTPLYEAGSSALPPIPAIGIEREASHLMSGVQSLEPDCQDSIPNLHLISTHQLCALKQTI